MLGASGEAQDVEGREKIRSGEASVGQFPMREETQSSCERPARLVHIRSDGQANCINVAKETDLKQT
jgi:hypothetical protein